MRATVVALVLGVSLASPVFAQRALSPFGSVNTSQTTNQQLDMSAAIAPPAMPPARKGFSFFDWLKLPFSGSSRATSSKVPSTPLPTTSFPEPPQLKTQTIALPGR